MISEQKNKYDNLNKKLGFQKLSDKEKAKHVHKLFSIQEFYIPQLVEWFLINEFTPNSLILDPFMGSGTTLVQCVESGFPCVGVDVSEFMSLITYVKLSNYDIEKTDQVINKMIQKLGKFNRNCLELKTDALELKKELLKIIDNRYYTQWFGTQTRAEIQFCLEWIENLDTHTFFVEKNLLKIILSKAIETSKLIPHFNSNQNTPLQEDQTYYCYTHKKECVPTKDLFSKFKRFGKDAIKRIKEFSNFQKNSTPWNILVNDSRKVTFPAELYFDGILTNPPYIDEDDYGQKYKYAFELFELEQTPENEIGNRRKGSSRLSQNQYVRDISTVLKNLKMYLKPDAKIIIIVSDKYHLYPEIAEESELIIEQNLKRSIMQRNEKREFSQHTEDIFIMKKRIDRKMVSVQIEILKEKKEKKVKVDNIKTLPTLRKNRKYY